MTMAASNPFLSFWSNGYRDLLPVIPPDAKFPEWISPHIPKSAGKVPGVKMHNGLWAPLPGWRTVEADEKLIADWSAMGASVGLRRGRVFLLDIDCYEEKQADEVEALALDMLGPAPQRVGQAPKRALLYRAEGVIAAQSMAFGGDKPGQIEIPNQCVVYGVHPKTGKPYAWPRRPVHIDKLSGVTADQLASFFAAAAKMLPAAKHERTKTLTERGEIDQASLVGPLEMVTEAVRRIPNTREHFPTYLSMILVGEAIHAALPFNPFEAKELWHEFCEAWEGGDYDFETTERRWRTFAMPHQLGAPYLYYLADKLGSKPGQVDVKALLHFDDLDVGETSAFEPKIDLNALKEKSDKFRYLNFAEASGAALTYSTRPLIKGLVDQSTMSVVYGDSNVGKTFVTMDIGHHVATGTRYAGMKTTAARVVYVAAEGGKGAMKRIAALEAKYGMPGDPSAFLLLPLPIDLRRPDADLNPFLASLNNLSAAPGLIIVDTLSRALAGGDENSSVDMGAIVKHFDVIRNAMGSHLMVVHHTGKNKAAGARGHSLLRAATDTEIEVAEGQIAVTKQRDLDKSWSSGFSLEVRTLGIDEDMDPITSCTVRLVSKAEAASNVRVKLEPTAAEARVLDCLTDMIEDLSLGANGVTVDQLMAASEDRLSGMNAELLRAHLRNLKEKGHVVRPKRGFWALETEDFASSVSETERNSEGGTEENGRKRNADIFE